MNKLETTIKDFIVYSSADPSKIALTIKGAIVFVPTLVILLSVFGLNVDPNNLTQLILNLSVFASGVVTIFGLGRKLLTLSKVTFVK